MGPIWYYKNSNVEGIQKFISLFNWEKTIENISINEKIGLLNNTLLNIFHYYIPKKIVKGSYRDPPWIIISLNKKTSKITREYYRKGQDPIMNLAEYLKSVLTL